jgi:hypothetical protein
MTSAVWLFRLGCALITVAALSFFGTFDLLPVDLIPWIYSLWHGSGSGSHAYMRSVPIPASVSWVDWLDWLLLVVGVGTVVLAAFLKPRSHE